MCVLDASDAQPCIAFGRRLANQHALPLKVIAAFRHKSSDENAQMMQRLYNLCAKYNAELTVLFHESPAMTVAITAHRNGAAHLVCKVPTALGFDLVTFFRQLLPTVPLTLVESSGHTVTLSPAAIQTVS